jgi:hypothetical protein
MNNLIELELELYYSNGVIADELELEFNIVLGVAL